MAKVTKKVTKVEKTVKTVKKAVVVKKEAKVVAKPAKEVKATMSLSVYGLDGKADGKVSVSAEMFGDKVNKKLIAQAVRVYLANQRQGTVSTKTRGEVDGSTRKIYRQKGTGRARHGSVRAPIFVKGGIVFGPKPRDFSLDLPKKMKRKALFSSLSAKVIDNEVKVISGFEEIKPKTKNFVAALQKLELDGKKRSVLLVTGGKAENLKRSAGNIQGVCVLPANLLNTYEVIKHKHVVLMKEAISEMEKTFLNK